MRAGPLDIFVVFWFCLEIIIESREVPKTVEGPVWTLLPASPSGDRTPLSASMDLPFLAFPTNGIIQCVIWRLASLTKYNVSRVHLCCNVCSCFSPFHDRIVLHRLEAPPCACPSIC